MTNHLKRDRRTRAAFAAIREAADAAGVEVLEEGRGKKHPFVRVKYRGETHKITLSSSPGFEGFEGDRARQRINQVIRKVAATDKEN